MGDDSQTENSGNSVGRSLLSPRFLICAILLVVAGIWLTPTMTAVADRYRKMPIDLRQNLKDFDASKLPSFRKGWVIVTGEKASEGIGTERYTKIKFRKTGASVRDGHLKLFVTYYSDPKDKVPHTPEVCIRQEWGFIDDLSRITVDTPELAPDNPQIQAHLVKARWGNYSHLVLYVFYVEGQFRCQREQVRWVIAQPGNKHVYFSKIEVSATYPLGGDASTQIELCKILLREALAVLVKEYFPATEDLKRR